MKVMLSAKVDANGVRRSPRWARLVRLSCWRWYRRELRTWNGTLSHSFIALVLGLGIAALVIIWSAQLENLDDQLGVLGLVGFFLVAGGSVCRAYAHGVKKRANWDYVGKLITVVTLGFTGTAITAKVTGELRCGVLITCGVLAVLLVCTSIVYGSSMALRKAQERADRVAPDPDTTKVAPEPPVD